MSQAAIANNETSLSLSIIVQLSSSLLLGAVLLFGVGFASADVAHNAAHDTRHAFAFPCH